MTQHETRQTDQRPQEVALVTGGGHGIGRATVLRLAQEGYAVAVADIDEASADLVAAEVRGLGGTTLALRADVSRTEQVAAMVERAAAEWGRLDVLVNNAGRGLPGRVHELAEADWDTVIATTLSSVFYGAKYAIPHMLRQGGGRIVNIASVQGFTAHRRSAAYNAAKGGVINLTRNIALDYAREGIRCNCICPGHVRVRSREETAERMAQREIAYPEARTVEELEAMHPLGRVGTPEEISDVVAYLASPGASFITGAAIVADGGLTAQVLA